MLWAGFLHILIHLCFLIASKIERKFFKIKNSRSFLCVILGGLGAMAFVKDSLSLVQVGSSWQVKGIQN